MSYRMQFILFLVLAIPSLAEAQNVEDFKGTKPSYGFIENKGQVSDQDHNPNPDVKYILPLANNNIVLRPTGFSYDTYVVEEENPVQTGGSLMMDFSYDSLPKKYKFKYHRVDVEFVDASAGLQIVASRKSKDFINYNSSADGRELKVYHYGKITYKNVYRGIDVEFIAMPGQLKPVEYNFIVNPGAHISDIELVYKGAKTSRLNNGQLRMVLGHGNLSESIPRSYTRESNRTVDIGYRQIRKNGSEIALGFAGADVSEETLVIDPVPDLDWGTYFGGDAFDTPYDILYDGSGNLYVAGSTNSTNLIATNGSYQTTFQGASDAYLIKFSSAGVRAWGTYIGGAGDEIAFGLATTGSGNIYLAGVTYSTNLISTAGAHQEVYAGGTTYPGDAFIMKFNPTGVRQWGTYFGGDGTDAAYDITLDGNENIYITGQSNSSNSISTPGSHQPSSSNPGNQDGFLAKFSPNGVRLWATYYGGFSCGPTCTAGDSGTDLATDASGNVYLLGSTAALENISTPGAHQVDRGGINSQLLDLFLVKFNSSGVRQWGTYYGGEKDDHPAGIATDISGNVFIAGWTFSLTQISSSGSYQEAIAAGNDAFLVKFSPNGVRQWGTYFGGTSGETASSLAIDNLANLYITGNTTSPNLATSSAYQTTLQGGNDAYLVKFTSNGQREWCTYYGGAGGESSTGVTNGTSGELYLCGNTNSTSMIATPGAHQTSLSSSSDAYLAKFLPSGCAPPTEAATLEIEAQSFLCSIQFNLSEFSNCSSTYSWDFGDGSTSLHRNPLHVYASPGTYDVSVQIAYTCASCSGDTTLTKQVTYALPSQVLEDRVVEIVTDIKEQVISTEATSFSDAWPLDQTNGALDDRSPFVNGSQGVWRNGASFVYEKDRKLSDPPNLATDGTFTLEQFNWEFAELNAVPNWIRANKMTRYSPYSYELENQDVLGNYSGAIYDYGGQLPAANGVNMRNDEMAFTSFEHVEGTVAGNWNVSSGSTSAFRIYKINAGNYNLAIVEASLAELQDLTTVDVVTDKAFSSSFLNLRKYTRNEIVCRQAHPENSAWSIIVLKTSPFDGIWTGSLKTESVISLPGSSVIETAYGHTGTRSLRVSAATTFRQTILHPDPGKSYYVNCWVSINDAQVTTPVLAPNLGIDIIAKDKSGQLLSTFSFGPSGPVIEGWQQLSGSFLCPANTGYIEVKFKPRSGGSVWYDDLRLHPEKGNMKGYVYNINDYRLQAVLDEQNFASYFYYDKEGNLYLTKKETKDGIKTLAENISYQVERP